MPLSTLNFRFCQQSFQYTTYLPRNLTSLPIVCAGADDHIDQLVVMRGIDNPVLEG